MYTPTITINDVPALGQNPVVWSLTQGSDPFTASFQVDGGSDAKRILDQNEVTLRIERPDGTVTTFEHLTAIREAPENDEVIHSIFLADRRWKWDRKHIFRRYNVTRGTGDRTFQGENEDVPILPDPVEPDVEFIPDTLRDGKTPWTVGEIFRDILESVAAIDGAPVDIRMGTIDASVIENIELDANARDALGELLRLVPNAGVFITPTGTITAYDQRGGGEGQILDELGPPVGDSPSFPTFVSMRNMRPKNFKVLFTAEHDLAFFYEEREVGDPGATLAQLLDDDSRYMDNVLPCPDPILTITDSRTQKIRKVAAGSWITFEEAINAWNSEGTGPTITMQDIRLNYLWSKGWERWTEKGVTASGAIWARRINAITQHWRRSFRLNRRWVDKLRTLEARRVSVRTTRGTFSPAVAYADLTTRVQELGQGDRAAVFERKDHIKFEAGLDTTNAGDPLLGSARPANGIVSVPDSEAGIIRVDWGSSPMDPLNDVVPGAVDNAITVNLKRQLTDHVNWDSARINGNVTDVPQMSANFVMIVIVSGVSGVPNNTSALHVENVTPDDLKGLVDIPNDGTGPDWEIRVGRSIETAKFAWKDSRRADIEQAFGIPSAPAVRPDLSELLVNGVEGGRRGRGPLHDFAVSFVASLVSILEDRTVGQVVGDFNPSLTIQGVIDQISHILDPDGAFRTAVNFPDQRPRRSLVSMLPQDVRAAILKQVS